MNYMKPSTYLYFMIGKCITRVTTNQRRHLKLHLYLLIILMNSLFFFKPRCTRKGGVRSKDKNNNITE